MTRMTREAFEALASRHRPRLQARCYRMLRSREAAEDAVQETLLRAWRSQRASRDHTALGPWLYRIATNACLDEIARARRHRVASQFGDLRAPREQEPDAAVMAQETIELLFLQLVRLLPPRQRTVVLLRDVMDISAAETAQLLDLSPAAVNSLLQRAHATLRAHARADVANPIRPYVSTTAH